MSDTRHILWNHEELVGILEEYSSSILCYFSGHYHIGGFIKHNDIFYWGIKATLTTEDSLSFLTVDVYQDHLQVTGHGVEVSRTLKK